MRLARWSAVATALLLLSIMESPAQAAGNCGDAAELTVVPSPLAPWKGAPLRVMVVSEKPLQGTFSLIAPDGSVAAKSAGRLGGGPYSWFAEVAEPAAGTWHATLALDRATADCSAITRDIAVSARKPDPLPTPPGSIWKVRATWNSTTEALFSAWIEKLFDAPPEQDLNWKVWHEVLRDKSRNFLFNYLGRGEDNVQTGLRPDCADFVYFLRAYFAFKMGLPFGYSNCSRGTGGKPPKCYQWFDIEHPEVTRPPPPPEQDVIASADPTAAAPPPAPAPGLLRLLGRQQPPPDPVATAAAPILAPAPPPKPKRPSNFGEYLRDVGDVVHTGAVRVAGSDDNTDFYTIPLTQKALRPGTVYADPYGHVLMLVHRVPEVNGMPGVFLAVDAEPDGSITRKRFWRGNFLFVHDPALGSPGFKHFRPIVSDSGRLRRLSNAEIGKNPQYADFSLDQSKLSAEDFYDRMDDVMSPEPLDPVKAMTDAITSLDEQVKTRVTSVENGRKYQQKQAGDTAMPNGPSIFETTGAWEDYSTPARDFRLLIAIDVVRGYPDHVARRADRYAMAGKGIEDVKRQLQGVLASELTSRKITYTRSDGSPWTLSLKDVIDRAADFEMAYNPNDCVELRWGAPENSEEASTCKRRAPAAQRAKMSSDYRIWFRERHWPTHA
ncbi:hypothetical protein [Bradyrhizobium canariense]|uniref:Uncharacterized protein n=1 Tax=Bradyrhizobium canariense TaxID=255045 RepID=A0A1H2B1E6_9BRAD|nr:hypothetical protein [Bradyrhizobium canariense]SDT51882.1 hypothetical protein SAMN05444158_6683 [Bradyrhizobium canariense]